jgi:hypothetical protein
MLILTVWKTSSHYITRVIEWWVGDRVQALLKATGNELTKRIRLWNCWYSKLMPEAPFKKTTTDSLNSYD